MPRRWAGSSALERTMRALSVASQMSRREDGKEEKAAQGAGPPRANPFVCLPQNPGGKRNRTRSPMDIFKNSPVAAFASSREKVQARGPRSSVHASPSVALAPGTPTGTVGNTLVRVPLHTAAVKTKPESQARNLQIPVHPEHGRPPALAHSLPGSGQSCPFTSAFFFILSTD